MNEVFTFSRFGKFFLYDLKTIWRNHRFSILTVSLIGVICFLFTGLFGLIFEGKWNLMSFDARVMMIIVGVIIMVLYNAKTYGYLTEKRAGSDYLMLPASTTEKFISMMLNTMIVLPLAFFVIYLSADALMTVCLPGMGGSLLCNNDLDYFSFFDNLDAAGMEGISLPPLFLILILDYEVNSLWFLLSGLIFKRAKIAVGIAWMLLFQILMVFVITHLGNFNLIEWARDSYDGEEPMKVVNDMIAFGLVFSFVMMVAMMVGTFFRLKSLKH